MRICKTGGLLCAQNAKQLIIVDKDLGSDICLHPQKRLNKKSISKDISSVNETITNKNRIMLSMTSEDSNMGAGCPLQSL